MTSTTARPPVPHRAHPLFRWQATIDKRWVVISQPDLHTCRAGAGFGTRACGRRPVAALMRNDRRAGHPVAWHYCRDHLYGGWIENGHVMHWVLRPVADSTS